MSIERVRRYLAPFGYAERILSFDISSATVALAAEAVGTEPARIAKSLTLRSAEEGSCIMVVTAGDQKIDNKKFRDTFGVKARFLTGDEVSAITGYAIGGVSPFDLGSRNVSVWLDESMKRFETVFPAAGNDQSAIELSCDELERLSGAKGWADVCKPIEPAAEA